MSSDIHDLFLLEPDMGEKIVLRRDETGVYTNVPHLVRHHSPSGYEWGYGGSGPADLALNIVEAILRRERFVGPTTKDVWDKSTIFRAAYRLHQGFKWAFIAPAPKDNVIIAYEDARAWVYERLGKNSED